MIWLYVCVLEFAEIEDIGVTLIAQTFKHGHRISIPIFDEARHNIYSEFVKSLFNGCNEGSSNPSASLMRQDGQAINPPLSTVVCSENGPHNTAVDLRHQEDGALPGDLLRNPFSLISSVRFERKPRLLSHSDERVVVSDRHLAD